MVVCVKRSGSTDSNEHVDRFGGYASHHAAALEGVLACLAAVGHAGGLVDQNWKVMGINLSAQALICEMMSLHDGRLTGATPEIDSRLQQFRRSMHRANSGVAVFERERGSSLIAQATRMSLPVGPAAIILTFAMAGEIALPAETVLREAFGLTATEACIALSIAKGLNLRDIALSRSVAIDTVRSHLRIIFTKTGTRRQASLIVLIVGLRGVGGWTSTS